MIWYWTIHQLKLTNESNTEVNQSFWSAPARFQYPRISNNWPIDWLIAQLCVCISRGVNTCCSILYVYVEQCFHFLNAIQQFHIVFCSNMILHLQIIQSNLASIIHLKSTITYFTYFHLCEEAWTNFHGLLK